MLSRFTVSSWLDIHSLLVLQFSRDLHLVLVKYIKWIFFSVKSKSVDVTLANILEGQVSYTALTSEEIEMEKRKQIEKKAETGKQLVRIC